MHPTRLLALACAVLLTSCGAIGSRVIASSDGCFRGVRADKELITGEATGGTRCDPCWAFLDMPFSLVADIILIPYDISTAGERFSPPPPPAGKSE